LAGLFRRGPAAILSAFRWKGFIMMRRIALAAAVVFAASAAQALPMDRFTLPNDNAQPKKDSADGLFDHSVPDRWDNDSTSHADDNSSSLGHFHFTATGSNYNSQPQNNYGPQDKPLSEFRNLPQPQQQPDDPLFNH
jgi:hypothetical protein